MFGLRVLPPLSTFFLSDPILPRCSRDLDKQPSRRLFGVQIWILLAELVWFFICSNHVAIKLSLSWPSMFQNPPRWPISGLSTFQTCQSTISAFSGSGNLADGRFFLQTPALHDLHFPTWCTHFACVSSTKTWYWIEDPCSVFNFGQKGLLGRPLNSFVVGQ